MAYQAIGIGSSANDGTGDDLRTAGDKINDNFVEVYTLLGTGSALSSGISATGSVITLTAPLITTSLNPSSANGAALGSASAEWSDLYLADGGVIYLGADQDVRIIHDADDGLLLKTSAGSDDNPFTLILQTGETDLEANDIIGSLSFQAPDELSEGDSRLVSASVDAVAEGTFSATNNATKLSFKLGVSETATEKMSLSSAGLLTIADDLVIGDGKTIGSTSDPDAMTISASGVVTFSQSPNFGLDLTIEDDLFLDSDAAVVHFGEDGDVTLTHVADTGLLLNSTMALQFNDASQFINAPSATVLDINATDEIELNATLVDVNANLDVSGTGVIAGALTTAALTASGIIKTDDTTAATSTTDGSLQTDGGLSVVLDAVIGDDIIMLSDAAQIAFGADSDVTLTHVADTGLLLNSTMALQFNDASQYINAPSATVLDINATDEIELNATLVDINGNVEISGTAAQVGVATFTARPAFNGGITIANAGQIGSAGDLDAIAIASDGVVTFSQAPVFAAGATLTGSLGISTSLNPDASDGATLGTTALEWSDLYLADGAQILFGDDQEVTLTHVADTGLLLNGTNQLQFNDSSQFINAPTNAILDITATDEIELNATLIDVNGNLDVSGTVVSAGNATFNADVIVEDDLFLDSDAAVIHFGEDGDVTLTHVADTGILLNSTMAIQFNDASQFINAPSATVLDINATDEIELNATLLDVNANINASGTYTGAGLMTTGGNIVIPDGGTIGAVSDTDAITISASGVVTFSQTPVYSGDAQFEDDIIMDSDGAVLSMGENNEITFTHVHDAGVTITNTINGTDNRPMVLQLKSEEDAIAADDVIASIELAAGDSDGTDGATVAAGIHAIAEGTFSASANATKLVFTTGVSETAASSATAKMTLSSAGLLTIADDFVMKDGGTIGSVSDTDAIGISSGGVVSISATTASTSATSGALTVAGGAGIAADLSVGDDLRLISDAAVFSFGADSDVTLTHVADTGLLLNSTMAIQFNDASQFINAPSNAILDINATDEIELNATLVDVNANLDVSGTYTGAGLMTTGGNIVIPDAGTIGSASDADALAIGSDGDITLTQDLELQHDGAILSFGANDEVTLTHVHDTGLLLNSTMAIQFNDASQFINAPSNAILDINATDEIELNATLVDVNANLDVSGTYQGGGTMTTGGNIVIPDAGTIGSASDTNAISISSGGVVAITATTASSAANNGALTVAGGAGIAADLSIGDDLRFLSDASLISFGANSEITLTHVHDVGLTLTHTSTADNTPIVLQLKSEEDIIIADEVIASIEFAAGDSDGTDGATVAAGIHAIAEGTFSASANATKLVFTTGVSETAASSATAKATLSSIGDFQVAGDLVVKDDGLIGSASDLDAMSISSGGVVNFSARPTFAASLTIQDGGSLGSASDLNAMTISGGGVVAVTATTASTNATSGALTVAGGAGIAADLSVGDDVRLISDAAVLSFGADADVTLTHVADTGLLLNSTMAIQFNDASQYINAPSNAILDINATDEIELNATLVDVNANLDVSGTYTGAGLMTTGGNIVIPNAGYIGSAGDTDAIQIEADGDIVFTQDVAIGGNLTVSGTTTQVDTVTMEAANAVVFEGATADDHETTLTIIDPTADRTQRLLNQSGYIPLLAAVTTTAITSTPEELNILDGATVVVGEINALDLGSTAVGNAIASKAVILDSSKDYTGIRNLTISGEIDAATGDYSGAVDIAGATTTAAITASGIIKTDDSTAATSTTDGSLQTDGGLSVVLDAVIGDDLILLSDAAVIHFGADKDVTLTHVADTGLLLNGTSVIQFNDASQNIGAPSATVLDINATDEIELNATLVDVNANLDVSGTYTGGGTMTTGGNIVIPDAGTIGSASDTDAIAIGSDGDITLTQDLELQHDGAILSFGANDEVTLTHVHNTGILLNSTMAIQFNDASQYINAPSNAILDINATDEIELNATLVDVNANLDVSGTGVIAGALTTAAITASGIIKTDDSTAATSTTDGSLQTDGGLSVVLDAVIGDDIIMLSDAAQIAFGANSEITLAHVHNVGLTVTHVTAGDNLPVVLQLKSEEDVVVANEVIASIEFAAGDSDGTDGATVAAGIHAIAEDTFSASANATKLVFTTGVSETAASSATAKATLSSIGDFTIAGDLIIKDGGTIGSASDLDAMAIASNGVVTFSQAPVFPDGSIAVADLDIDGATDIGADIVDADLFIIDDGAGGTNRKTTAARIKTYIGSSVAADDIGVGDGAINLTTSSGNITIDAAANDSDIIFKGTDGGADITALTLDMSAVGHATFNVGATFGGNLIIPDAGTIGSASDVNAIAIGSDGDVTLTQDLELQHDGAILSFGADDDVTITHVHDTGILLNSTMAIQFNDASQYINAPSNAILDINATDEIELNATLIDVNGNLDVSGTGVIAGAVTTAALTASGIIKTDDTTAATSTTDGSLQTDGGLSVAGDAVIGDDLILLSDAAVIHFGADKDVSLTHVHNTGILLNSTNVIQFNDASQNIGAPSATVLDINATDEIELNATLVDVNANLDVSGTGVIAGAVTTAALTASGIIKTDDTTNATTATDGSLQTDGGLSVVLDAVFGDDVKLLSDASVLSFGTNSDITVTHVHDTGLTITNVIADTDNRPIVFQLKSEEDAIVANDVLASIEFAAGDSDGTDGATVAAGIHAIAEDTFSASANKTKLVFTTGVSETAASSATAKATLSSIGDLTIAGDLIIKDGGTIGSASDLDAIAIASNGVVTFSQIPVMPANSIDSDEYIDGSIDREHLAADIIDGTKIADDVINSEHYAAGSIDREHLAADIIDGTKIADDAINSEHYAAGSIDNEHIADDAINSEHYAADSIDEEHIANDAVGSAELKTLSTLLIKNSGGTTLKTLYGAGA